LLDSITESIQMANRFSLCPSLSPSAVVVDRRIKHWTFLQSQIFPFCCAWS